MLQLLYAIEAEIIPFEPDPGNTGVEKNNMKRQALQFVAAMSATSICVSAHSAELSDTSLVYNLDDVVVEATRADAKTPLAFTNVKSAELAKSNTGQDLPYLLQATPSVITTSDAGAGVGYTSIRVRGTDGSRINVTTNGVPVNNPESHVVYWVNTPDIASSLKDVQIQRGAGTSTNGAGAFGASINMVTQSVSSSPYGELNASYGMYNTHKETLKIGTGLLNDHWVVEARLSNIGTDGYIDRAWSNLWSYLGQAGYYNGSTSLRFVAFGGKERTYMAWDYASKEQMEKYGRRYNPCGEYTDSDGKTAYYDDQVDNYIQHNFQLLLNHSFNSRLSLNAALFYVKGDGYYEQYKTHRTLVEYGLEPFIIDGEKVSKSDLIRLKKMDNGFGGGVFSLTFETGRAKTVVGGGLNNYRGHHFGQVAWVRNYIGNLDPQQEYYRNLGDKLDANIYAKTSVDITKNIAAYIDLQYRHLNYSIKGVSDTYDWNTGAMQLLDIKRRYNFFNPKAGLNYAIDHNNRAYASWSVAHREPTRDNFIDCAPDRLPKAERLFDYEAGYEYRNRIFSGAINLYYMSYKDQLIPTGQLSDTGNPVSVNVPDSYRMGTELSLELKPCNWFDWNFTTTLSRNRIKNFTEYIYEDEWTNPITFDIGNTPIAFSPDLTFHNSFNFNWRKFDASLQSHYVSRQYMTNAGYKEQSLDPYFVSDLSIGCTLDDLTGIKNMRIGLTIYNLFSEEYENNGYAGTGYYMDGSEKVIYRYAGYAAQAPIHVMGSVSLKF